MKPEEIERIEALKDQSTLQLLFRAARRANEEVLAILREEPGLAKINPSHTAVFPHLDFEGTRVVELAQRMEISKQAVSKLVADLAEMKAVELVPDPSDGRAKLVRFTETMLTQGLNRLIEYEQELARELGEAEMLKLRGLVRRLNRILDQ